MLLTFPDRDANTYIFNPPILPLSLSFPTFLFPPAILLLSAANQLIHQLPQDGKTRCTTGSVVSSLYHLKDTEHNNEDAGFFVFPDLSVRTEGSYRCVPFFFIRSFRLSLLPLDCELGL